MSMTSFVSKITLTEEYGYTLEEHDIVVPGETIPMYIPKLMSNIKKDKPSEYRKVLSGRNIFKNANECLPNIASLLTFRNYLEPKLLNNSSWNGIVDKNSRKIPEDTKMTCSFPIKNSVKELYFTTSTTYGITEFNDTTFDSGSGNGFIITDTIPEELDTNSVIGEIVSETVPETSADAEYYLGSGFTIVDTTPTDLAENIIVGELSENNTLPDDVFPE